ncbi:MAG: HD domain-containing phosphohydrolase [Pseudomonadota bacterium]
MTMDLVLIVSQDATFRGETVETVSVSGYKPLTATSPEEALGIIGDRKVDILILDVDFTESRARRIMNQAREVQRDLWIIITAPAMTGLPPGGAWALGDDFLRQPFAPDELKLKLNKIQAQKRLEAENRRLIKEQAALTGRLSTLLNISLDMTSELEVEKLFPLIISKVSEALEAERTSLYLIDWTSRELWTKVAEKVDEIRLPLGAGISGMVAETGNIINTKDAWNLPYFNPEFDRKHDFRTKAMICLPIRNQLGERIGVLQVMNKKGRDFFDEKDEILLKGLTAQVGIALENSLLHDEMRLSFESSIKTLAATVDARHPLTAGHSLRVTEYALGIAEEMQLNDRESEVLKYAAVLHDIGKIGVRDEVLLKNGPFTPEEREEMNSHTIKTREILNNFHFPKSMKDVPRVAAGHHEKVNGQGYPDGLTGDRLSLGSKILAVADVFDALTSNRDYPKYPSRAGDLSTAPMPLKQAVGIMVKETGSHFDPEVVDYFLRCLPRILIKNRGSRFAPEYVDPLLGSLPPKRRP